MNTQEILSLIQSLIMLGCGGLTLYFKFSTKAQTKAKEIQELIAQITAQAVVYIAEAEKDYKDTTQSGGKKFEQVVSKLYDLVPDALHGIVTKEMISEIVQSTFDEIQEYVRLQLDNSIDKIEVKKD
jgi:hypothetical protein